MNRLAGVTTGSPRHWPKRRFVGAVSRMRCSSPGLQVHSKSKTPVANLEADEAHRGRDSSKGASS